MNSTSIIEADIKEVMDEKRKRAIEYLGARYVLHPKHEQNPHHSPSHRNSALLAPIILKAKQEGRL